MPDFPEPISLGGGRHSVDTGAWIKRLLESHWDSSNTDGGEPKVHFAEQSKAFIFRDRDNIVLYSVSKVTEPITITYGFSNETEVVTLDFFTSGDRTHLVKMVEEARRILLQHRKDTLNDPSDGRVTGRSWLEWGIRESPYDRTAKGYYRRTIDCRVNWRYRQVEV